MTGDMKFQPGPAPILTGDERFTGLDHTVKDFWSYAARDLRSNVLRGVLAEWLVAKAVGATEPMPEWHAFDVLTPSGIHVEVKSSAYLQAWSQRELSTIKFSGLNAAKWDTELGPSDQRTFNADVYVFCVQTAQSHDAYDPLDVSQWDFYVLPRSRIESIGYRNSGLTRIKSMTQRVSFDGLAAAIDQAAAKNPVRDPRE
ncbi:hypothetical protein [Mycobacterium neglectum]|uniref:hypothetical protein n=1 Tax=Mycobacterium neglectum TaxID=242737 RepID=UPI000BFEDC39|nr:hypothetical protein [Mycobacterium neglectum]